jgi:hypothetical protein
MIMSSALTWGHHILFNDTTILVKKLGIWKTSLGKQPMIELHTDNMNKEKGFSLSRSCMPLV